MNKQRLKFLVVDDSTSARTMLTEMLSEFGRTVEAEDGDKAVAAFERAMAEGDPFDAVMMDIMMPGTDGLTALKTILDLERRLEVPPEQGIKSVMISCLDDSKHIIKAHYEVGADVYIPKPFEREILVEALMGLGLIPSPLDESG